VGGRRVGLGEWGIVVFVGRCPAGGRLGRGQKCLEDGGYSSVLCEVGRVGVPDY
jgi:hypothetical protein